MTFFQKVLKNLCQRISLWKENKFERIVPSYFSFPEKAVTTKTDGKPKYQKHF